MGISLSRASTSLSPCHRGSGGSGTLRSWWCKCLPRSRSSHLSGSGTDTQCRRSRRLPREFRSGSRLRLSRRLPLHILLVLIFENVLDGPAVRRVVVLFVVLPDRGKVGRRRKHTGAAEVVNACECDRVPIVSRKILRRAYH